MGRGTVAAGDGGGATTSRHCPSVSPAGCHLPMASPQGRINGKAETMIKLYGTPPTRALRAMWLRSEEHTSELQSLMRISYAVFCLKKKKHTKSHQQIHPLFWTDDHIHPNHPTQHLYVTR